MTNLADILAATVSEHAERTAIKLDDVQLNYGIVDEVSARAAGVLQAAGIEEGDRVGIMLPNVPYFPFFFDGAMRLGAIVVPMNPLLKDREVGFHLEDSGAKILVAWHQFEQAATDGASAAGAEAILVKPGETDERLGKADPVREIAPRKDEDTALILYTSGTTATPK